MSERIAPVRYDLAGKRVYVAGHRGKVGAALVRQLGAEGCEILAVDRGALDLRDQAAVNRWMAEGKPDAVLVAAARVGGIGAQIRYPAQFAYDTQMIQANLIEAARRAGTARLLLLASSAIYPIAAEQPIREDALLTGPLDPTHENYALAKLAGVGLVASYRRQYRCDYISAVPTNLYGPGDDFDPETSAVVPALIRKAHEAKAADAPAVTIWGSGTPRRDLLHAEDCAGACIHLMKHYSSDSPVNVGSGSDISVRDLMTLVCDVVGYGGAVLTDPAKPDGVARRLLSVEKLRGLGWEPRIPLEQGLAATYRWFIEGGKTS